MSILKFYLYKGKIRNIIKFKPYKKKYTCTLCGSNIKITNKKVRGDKCINPGCENYYKRIERKQPYGSILFGQGQGLH